MPFCTECGHTLIDGACKVCETAPAKKLCNCGREKIKYLRGAQEVYSEYCLQCHGQVSWEQRMREYKGNK